MTNHFTACRITTGTGIGIGTENHAQELVRGKGPGLQDTTCIVDDYFCCWRIQVTFTGRVIGRRGLDK